MPTIAKAMKVWVEADMDKISLLITKRSADLIDGEAHEPRGAGHVGDLKQGPAP
jgi:hypothetical protein